MASQPRVLAVAARSTAAALGMLLSALPVAAADPWMARVPAAHLAARQDSVAAEIQRLVTAGPVTGALAGERWRRVRLLYGERGHAPLWPRDSTVETVAGSAAAQALIDALAAAPSQALVVDHYPLAELRDALVAASARAASPVVRARADVMLTATFVAYASDVLVGQIDPRSVNREWHISPRTASVDSAISASLRHDSVARAIELLRPQDPDYGVLMRELARYRRLVASGGWPRLPSLGVLRPGDTTSVRSLGLLLARLHVEGYTELIPLAPASTSGTPDSARRGAASQAVYDLALAGAVARYQQRHELTVDSIVGPNTLASLNQPADFRLRQIAANLERHRWLPRERGERHVLVNVPAFRLHAYDAGREVLTMNVVVGAEYGGRTTPVFSDSMAYVVFRPYWNVPQGIADRELWPKQRQDPGYFARNGYEVVRASWGTYVRQKPAADNALGRAKFIFPNDYAIYLHDTPSQALFAERVRAFSHGCIRVEHPDQLAEFVLGPQGWDIGRVREAMTNGEDDHRVNLERKLPVYIVYFTMFARDGVLHFGNDIYDRDAALVRAVGGATAPDERTLRALESLQGGTPRSS